VLSLAGAFDRLGAVRAPGHLREVLGKGDGGFACLLDELSDLARQGLGLGLDAPVPVIVLPLDQAEELFNPDGAAEAARFFDLISGVLARPAGALARRLLIVATIALIDTSCCRPHRSSSGSGRRSLICHRSRLANSRASSRDRRAASGKQTASSTLSRH
jgi:hypothetical protein